MKLIPLFTALLLVQASGQVLPPAAPVRPVVDDYYGTKVVDPYRYMENLNDPEVQAWFKAQNDYARAVLSDIPGRSKLRDRLHELDRSAAAQVSDVRHLPGEVYIYQKLVIGQDDIPKLYLRQGLSGEEKLVLDPGKIKLARSNQAKGKASIGYYQPSHDGKFVMVGFIAGGSEDDTELHVFETATGHETGDVILRAPLGDIKDPHWLPDNRSFLHGRLDPLPAGAPADERYDKWRSYLHVLGTDPGKDPPVFGYGVYPSIPVPVHGGSWVKIPPNSRYAFGAIDAGIGLNNCYYLTDADSIGKHGTAWRKFTDFSDNVRDVAVHGDDLYLLTFQNAPRYKVLRLDARKPDLTTAETVVPASESVVTGMFAAQDALYVQLLDGGISRLLRVEYGPKPRVERLKLPFEGGIWGAVPAANGAAFNDPRVPGILFEMTGWTKAEKIYSYDPKTQQVSDTRLLPPGPYDDPGNIESVEVKVRSYDRTLVPLSIAHAKGLKRDGSNPVHLVGYGAYGNVQSPGFFPGLLAFYEKNGIFASCHVRGGGDYGEEWHLAGKSPTKPNTWKDFIACAQYLIDEKYTSAEHISAFGGSAGGILIGGAITERPDLFGAAIITSGALNILRQEVTGNGPSNFEEFGNTKTEQGFKAPYEMDATQHVKDGTAYPAVLLLVGMNDPRTDPWYSAKFAARLQAATTSGKPILLRVNYAGGHFAGEGLGENEILESNTDMIGFDLWQLGAPSFQPTKQRDQ